MPVVHCKKDKYDVYIGRPGRWGNPFALRSEEDRERVIEKYRAWLHEQLSSGDIRREDVLALRGKTLGCWCAPRACHGDVLLEVADQLHREE